MQNMKDTSRRVWMLARPLSLASYLPVLAGTSDSKFHLCHSGVLITTNMVGIKYDGKLKRISDGTTDDGSLGTIYELKRVGTFNTVHVSSSFGSTDLPEWSRYAVQYVGLTHLSDEDISSAGTSPQSGIDFNRRNQPPKSRKNILLGLQLHIP